MRKTIISLTLILMYYLAIMPCTCFGQNIYTIAGDTMSTIAYGGDNGPATAAELSYPFGTAFDAAGNMYIADAKNSVIRMVNTAGIIITFAGDTLSAGTYGGDGGAATAAGLSFPAAITFDAAGNLYIADLFDNVVRMVNTSGIINTVVGSYTAGGTYSGDGAAATAAGLNQPIGLAFDALGNLYIADENNDVVRMVNTAGIISTYAGSNAAGGTYAGDGAAATEAGLNDPTAIAIDAMGNLYISDGSNNVVRMVNTSGIIYTIAGNNAVGGTYGGDGGVATAASLSQPFGLAFDAAANLYIADASNNVIRKVTTAGIISTLAGTGTGSYTGNGGLAKTATLHQPCGITLDASGNLYIADVYNNVVRVVSSALTLSLNATDTAICTGATSTITASGATTYSWSPATGLSAATGAVVAANPTITTTYNTVGTTPYTLFGVQVSSSGADSIAITVNTLPTLTITASSPTICAGNTTTLTASGASSYTWAAGPADSANAVSPTISTTYTVTGTNGKGCMSNDTLTVMVENCTTCINKLANNNNQIIVYPNPSNGAFAITTNKNAKTIAITDVLGNELLSITPSGTTTNVNIGTQPGGVYFIKVTPDNGQVITKRIIISN